jgi:hypothetical protein
VLLSGGGGGESSNDNEIPTFAEPSSSLRVYHSSFIANELSDTTIIPLQKWVDGGKSEK